MTKPSRSRNGTSCSATEGDGTFTDVTQQSGPGLQWQLVGRGAALSDYDNDGDTDIYVCNNNGPGVLLQNDGGNRGHWIAVKTVGTVSNRDGIGARITVRAGDLVMIEEVRSGSGYLSQNDLRVHFGLGERTMVDEIRHPLAQWDRTEDWAGEC